MADAPLPVRIQLHRLALVVTLASLAAAAYAGSQGMSSVFGAARPIAPLPILACLAPMAVLAIAAWGRASLAAARRLLCAACFAAPLLIGSILHARTYATAPRQTPDYLVPGRSLPPEVALYAVATIVGLAAAVAAWAILRWPVRPALPRAVARARA